MLAVWPAMLAVCPAPPVGGMADAVAVSFKGREAIGRGFESRYDQILTFCEKNENARLDCVEPFSRVAAVVVKPVNSDKAGWKWRSRPRGGKCRTRRASAILH